MARPLLAGHLSWIYVEVLPDGCIIRTNDGIFGLVGLNEFRVVLIGQEQTFDYHAGHVARNELPWAGGSRNGMVLNADASIDRVISRVSVCLAESVVDHRGECLATVTEGSLIVEPDLVAGQKRVLGS